MDIWEDRLEGLVAPVNLYASCKQAHFSKLGFKDLPRTGRLSDRSAGVPAIFRDATDSTKVSTDDAGSAGVYIIADLCEVADETKQPSLQLPMKVH